MTVEDGLVSMKFDNLQFERKLTETIASLDKLRNSLDFSRTTRDMGLQQAVTSIDKLRASLDFTNAQKSISDVNAAARKFDMSPMSHAVDGISTKFIAMSTIAITALSNITNRAIDSAMRISREFTYGPVQDGFREFETNMNSIQTILANTDSKGTTLEQVNAALDQLNHYSDQTIYNFSEMARNIGTFTAAGVDLDTSVNSIKGIANLAAISGSNSAQASTAMYQLSQAISTGTVRLMDWNSVVNAGMGGEVFQRALFETGKAMRTIEGVDLGTTFEEWTSGGNSFRLSLEQGWLTSEVLTNTLQGFTGDLNEAQLMGLGYTQAQAQEMMRLGELGKAAATEVKTFTQLVGTIKEGIASGWSQSFRTIIGDFEESKALFTSISNAVGGFFSAQADRRNEMLQAWADFGARDALLEGLRSAFEALGNVIDAVRTAFQGVFPPATAETLIIFTDRFRDMMVRFSEFTERIAPRLQFIFKGLFMGIEVGVEIIKGIGSVIGTVFREFAGGAGNDILDFFTQVAAFFSHLNQTLLGDNVLEMFFRRINAIIENPINAFERLGNAFRQLFEDGNMPGADAVGDSVENVTGAFGSLVDAVGSVGSAWDWLRDKATQILDSLNGVWEGISGWFGDLGTRIGEAFDAEGITGISSVIEVGILGGIALAIKNFFETLNDIDITGGFFDNANEVLNQLTGTLSAMQTELRSRTLQNIAIAVGILAAAVVVLAMVDPKRLGSALTALAIGFGQLMGAMAIMGTSAFSVTGVRMASLAATMVIMATAASILAIAIRALSKLNWDELARGLIGTAAGLGMMVTAMRFMTSDVSGLIRAGIAMSIMAVGLRLLAWAVKAFAELSWAEMAQGLIGVAAGLGIMVGALQLMPTQQLAISSVGILLIAVSMRVLANAVQAFSTMSWSEMGQGLLGVAGALGAIVLAMRLMPTQQLAVSSAGILLMSAALYVMAQAVQEMAALSFADMAQGIGGLAAMLLVLGVALGVMNGTMAGAVSLAITTAALYGLAKVLEILADLSIGQLVTGLVALAAVFGILGAATLFLGPMAPAMFTLGIAMITVATAFAIFGYAAEKVGKGFEALSRAGITGVGVLIAAIDGFVQAIPRLIASLIAGIITSVSDIVKAFPVLFDALKLLLVGILDLITEVAPEVAEALVAVINASLEALQEVFPQIVETGAAIIMALMRGIDENIDEFIDRGASIFISFVQGITEHLPEVVLAVTTMITTLLEELAANAFEFVAAGMNLLRSIIDGITNNLYMVTQAVTTLITTFLYQITASMGTIITYGADLLIWLLQGISDNITRVVEAVTNVITTFLTEVGNNTQLIIDTGFQMLVNFLSGIGDNLIEVVTTVGEVITSFVNEVSNQAGNVIKAGVDLIVTFISGLTQAVPKIAKAATELIIAFMRAIGDSAVQITNGAAEVIIDFINGIADAIRNHAGELRAAGRNLAGAILDGMTGGLLSGAAGVIDTIGNIGNRVISKAGSVFKVGSPSRVFMQLGGFISQGLAIGIEKDRSPIQSAASMGNRTIDAFNEMLKKVPGRISQLGEFQPTIRPVLDLSNVQNGSRDLAGMFSGTTLQAGVSLDQAAVISKFRQQLAEMPETTAPTGPTEVKFEQNIYAPSALTTNDIYKSTKSQIVMAKEELKI